MSLVDPQVKYLIRTYFSFKFTQPEILICLANNHGIVLSKSSLKRILKELDLFRRKNVSSVLDVAMFINDELNKTDSMHGYRWMQYKCLQNGLVVPRDDVAALMQLLDPDGIALRVRKRLKRRKYFSQGTDFVWHIDGYDKLKRYGIAVHGCIDGFSLYYMVKIRMYKQRSGSRGWFLSDSFRRTQWLSDCCPCGLWDRKYLRV